MDETGRLDRGDGVELAWARRPGTGPTIVFLPGFLSDMGGTKAVDLDAWCATVGRPMLRFDYSGHGASGGRFEEGTIGRWRDDALAAIDNLTSGKLILVGSSMGGWIALLVALARPHLFDAQWTQRAAAEQGFAQGFWPKPYLSGRPLPRKG